LARGSRLRLRSTSPQHGSTHDAGRQKLSDFSGVVAPLRRTAPRSEDAAVYSDLWDRQALPRLGGLPLRRITPEMIEQFQAEMRDAGGWRSHDNQDAHSAPVGPLDDARTAAQARQAHGRDLGSLMSYSGLRPGEALALRWDDIRSRTILVENALAQGEVKGREGPPHTQLVQLSGRGTVFEVAPQADARAQSPPLARSAEPTIAPHRSLVSIAPCGGIARCDSSPAPKAVDDVPGG
jgi:hypothetical protein